jgi:3,4-dihydroxyphenylacetate 2,3-dioxygenase
MGKLALAAKITHVPSMFISEMPGEFHGCRDFAIEGHREIGRRARELGVDTFIVLDTHWLVNSGYHINANGRHRGIYTSTEFPHFIRNLEYDYPGNTPLGDAIAARATEKGVLTRSHSNVESLGLEYGTLVPMKYMNEDSDIRVISLGGWVYSAEMEESKLVGEAIREAVEESDSTCALLASGSLSHRIWDNREVEQGMFKISKPFNKEVDLMVLDMWQEGRIAEFIDMLPDYAKNCSGEGNMHDTAMLLGALGWTNYTGKGEMLHQYFESSGTGQCNVVFPVI